MKLIATILTLFIALAANAQDSLFWSRPAYTTCFVQQSPDNYTWKTISKVQMADTNYTAPIPGATYYYRVLAGQDTSVCIYVFNEVLEIDTASVYHPAPKPKEFKVKVVGDRIEIESVRDEVCGIGIYNAVGQLLSSVETFLKRGLNRVYMPLPEVHGVYILSIQTGSEKEVRRFVK